MRFVYIMISILFSFQSLAQNDWKDIMLKLQGEKISLEEAQSEISKMSSIEDKVIEALDQQVDIPLALMAIRINPTQRLESELLKRLEKYSLNESLGEMYFVTLASVASSGTWDKLHQKVRLDNMSVPASLRAALMASALNLEKKIDSIELKALLDDPFYELRMAALENALLQDDHVKKEFLKKAMKKSPYTLRMRSLLAISKLPAKDKNEFQSILNECIKQDENQKVRELCSSIK